MKEFSPEEMNKFENKIDETHQKLEDNKQTDNSLIELVVIKDKFKKHREENRKLEFYYSEMEEKIEEISKLIEEQFEEYEKANTEDKKSIEFIINSLNSLLDDMDEDFSLISLKYNSYVEKTKKMLVQINVLRNKTKEPSLNN